MNPLWLLLPACTGRLPPALAPTSAPTAQAPTVAVDDLASAAVALVAADPLLRRPQVQADWAGLPGGAPIAAWSRLVERGDAQPADWFSLERSYPGTLAVPLARGARLADLESLLAGGLRPEDTARVVSLLAPLSDVERSGPSDIRPALGWAAPGAAATEQAAAVLHIAERGVLLGWLDAPDLPLAAPTAAMRPGIHDRLIDAPAGALILARGTGRRDAEAAAGGRADLSLATTLALADAAADTDSEQAALTTRLAQAAELLRAQGAQVPEVHDGALRFSLSRARSRLTADGGDDASAGLALVALTAERLRDQCPDPTCRGLDRVTTLHRAAAWGPEAAAAAAAWRVVAAKQALDTLEVTAERPTFGAAMPELVDVLLGEGAASVDLSLLRQASAGPVTWLSLTRAAGAPDATDADAGIHAIRALVVRTCDAALATTLPDDERELVKRIRQRAAS